MEMRERIARAIFNATFHPFDVENGLSAIKWAEWPDDRRRAEKQADAVLDAMRSPTEGMVTAGIIERHGSETPEAWKLATANIYTAMIDAARKPFRGDGGE